MRRVFALFIILSLLFWIQPSNACEFCTIAYMGKKEKPIEGEKHLLSAKVLFEHQDWKEIPASEAHNLHHQGHHTHDKQDEEIIHTILTSQVNDRLSFDVDIPYVTRHFIEIDSHAHLGENQTSKGLGDIILTGDYRLIQDPKKSFGVIAGVKTPSGQTNEHNSFEGLIEPELQPGSGSIDYLAGLAGAYHPAKWDLAANAVYVYKTQGAQDFRFGDVLSVTLFAGRKIEIKEKMSLKAGVLMNNQLEKKENSDDGPIKDSGGYTMLTGPQVGFDWSAVSLDFFWLFPAVQNLGGVHQELDKGGIWTSSVSVKF